jgi:hypothetical protein
MTAANPAIEESGCPVVGRLSESKLRVGRLMPSLFILSISVVRFNPSCEAAPFFPPITHPVASNVWRIRTRSDSRSVLGTAGLESLGVCTAAEEAVVDRGPAAGSGFGSISSFAKITARSIRFCSSRIFPGQDYDLNAAIVCGGMESICLPIRRLNVSTKWFTSSGMSSWRSRRGGREIGKTLRR